MLAARLLPPTIRKDCPDRYWDSISHNCGVADAGLRPLVVKRSARNPRAAAENCGDSGHQIGTRRGETTKTASGQRHTDERDAAPNAGRVEASLSLERVFPAPQGGVLLYSSFRRRIWRPALQRMGLPPVSIHSARASFISMLQASGVDVATAAKLAGHKIPNVTLQYHTHSLRDGREALSALGAACSET